MRRHHRDLATRIDRELRLGRLSAVLPGVYAPAALAESIDVRIAAAMLWDPDAVLVGEAAARVSFWPDIATQTVEVASRRRIERPGYRFTRREIPLELRVEVRGLRFTVPALTALDLCERPDPRRQHGGDGIDQALRKRAATLAGMHEALRLTRGRRGNSRRQLLLLDSRDEPWSAAERLAHRILRAAGLSGWKANHPVRVAGAVRFLDIAFPASLLALEIDGRLHETDCSIFESDRHRQNALVLAGWRVLRFTWAMLREDPDGVVETVRAALATTSCRSAGARSGR